MGRGSRAPDRVTVDKALAGTGCRAETDKAEGGNPGQDTAVDTAVDRAPGTVHSTDSRGLGKAVDRAWGQDTAADTARGRARWTGSQGQGSQVRDREDSQSCRH